MALSNEWSSRHDPPATPGQSSTKGTEVTATLLTDGALAPPTADMTSDVEGSWPRRPRRGSPATPGQLSTEGTEVTAKLLPDGTLAPPAADMTNDVEGS